MRTTIILSLLILKYSASLAESKPQFDLMNNHPSLELKYHSLLDTLPQDSVVFSKVEVESTFPGGNAGWAQYLSENLHYPKKAIRKNIQGTVVVQFIVGKDGKVSNVSVVRSVDPLLDEEAMRLIINSPNWTPAMQNGKKVKSYKKQPIVFQLVG